MWAGSDHCRVMEETADLSLEHIDPIDHLLVCGLKVTLNEVIAEASYNYSKANLFVPYRIHDYPAPVHPGDLGEFWINGGWVVTEFIGEWWWHEANKLSNARTFGRGSNFDSTPMWESRITQVENEFGVHIVVCSWDGQLRKAHMCRKFCPHHGYSSNYPLWMAVNGQTFCCRISAAAVTSRLGGAARWASASLHKIKESKIDT